MDNLKSLMRCLDDISNMIPEGTYLEMCDDLKRVHEIIPKDDDPPLLDTRRPLPLNVPFQVVQTGMDVHLIANISESESEGGSESESEGAKDKRTDKEKDTEKEKEQQK